MSRHMWACVAIVAMLAYQIETQVALACTADCDSNPFSNNCDCPFNENCHPNGDDIYIDQVYTHATECRVHAEVEWSCSRPTC